MHDDICTWSSAAHCGNIEHDAKEAVTWRGMLLLLLMAMEEGTCCLAGFVTTIPHHRACSGGIENVIHQVINGGSLDRRGNLDSKAARGGKVPGYIVIRLLLLTAPAFPGRAPRLLLDQDIQSVSLLLS